jgi:hypothetical protein
MSDNQKLQRDMNHALDNQLSEAEFEALQVQMAEAPETAEQWDKMQQVDRLLTATPKVAPLPGFANRVMAAIASMELPEFMNKRVGLGMAFGLLIVAFITIPVLSALLIGLVSMVTNAGAVHSFFTWVVEAAGYIIGIGKDITHELRALASDSPALPALITTLIPMIMLWAWLLWYLLGGPKFLAKR